MKLTIWKAASTELCGLHWLIYLIRILASQSKPILIHFVIYAICLGYKKAFSLILATLESAFEKSWTFILATKVWVIKFIIWGNIFVVIWGTLEKENEDSFGKSSYFSSILLLSSLLISWWQSGISCSVHRLGTILHIFIIQIWMHVISKIMGKIKYKYIDMEKYILCPGWPVVNLQGVGGAVKEQRKQTREYSWSQVGHCSPMER